MSNLGTYLGITAAHQSANNVVRSMFSELGNILNEVANVTGVAWPVLIGGGVALFLAIALLFDSSQGRGRRYRRGYLVAYRETLGKERAKMRADEERAGIKKAGWRERVKK